MKQIAIERTMRQINNNLINQLDQQQKQFFIKQFSHLYNSESKKIQLQLDRRHRVEQNKQQLIDQKQKILELIECDLKNKMQAHRVKRQKMQAKKIKRNRLMTENWQHKLQSIIQNGKKKRDEEILRAKQMREKSQQYWSTKEQKYKTKMATSMTNHSDDKPESYRLSYNQEIQSKQLPIIKKILHKNDSQIQLHQQKSIRFSEAKQMENLQMALIKLEQIQRKRQKVKKRIEQQTQSAKRNREIKQNPKYRANLREDEQKKRLKLKQRRYTTEGRKSYEDIETSKQKVDDLLKKHKQIKICIEENQIQERSKMFQKSMSRLRKGKMNKLVIEAVNLARLRALRTK